MDWYIDDNETIYASAYERFEEFGGTTSKNMIFGLQDIADLSGTSKVFVNKVTMRVNSFLEPDSTTSSQPALLYCLGGVCPTDYLDSRENPTNRLDNLKDYQDVKAFPLKGMFGFSTYARDDNSEEAGRWQGVLSSCNWQKTWRPRDALLLNRLQSVVFNVDSVYGTAGGLKGFFSMELQLKRGD